MRRKASVLIREPFGPLTGTLVPPFISHAVALIEGLLALQQGVKCITLGYGQAGNLAQDIAAIRSLRKLAQWLRFTGFGHDDYVLSTVFHQWMGGFPENEAQAYSVIALGAAAAKFAGRNQDHREDPPRGKRCSDHGSEPRRASSHTTDDQYDRRSRSRSIPARSIKSSMHRARSPCRYASNFPWRRRCRRRGAVLAFELGVMDVPFAPAKINAGRMTPVRDNHGNPRLRSWQYPLSEKDILAFHLLRKLPNAQPRKAGMRHSKWLWTTLERSLRAI